MTVEPYAVRFQIGALVMPHKSRTTKEYQADLKRKYGKMPSMAELASIENRILVKAQVTTRSEGEMMQDCPRLQSLRERAAKKSRAACDRILSCLTEPKTAAAVASEVGFSTQHVGALLRAAYERGEVARSTGIRITIWSRA